MRIHKIDITNFMGFEHQSFEFDKDISVIVGNNTAGKTTVLKALQIALGAYLKSLHTLPHDKANTCNFSQSDVFLRYVPSKKDFFANEERTRIDVQAEVCAQAGWHNIHWWREFRGNQTTHSQACAGELIAFAEELERRRSDDNAAINAVFPLVLAFGANRIDNQYRAATKTKERASRIAKAYKSALKETVDFQGAFDWLYRYEQNYKRGLEFEGTREAFISALETAIPALSDIEVDTKNNELIAQVTVTGQNPTYHTFEQMSDGFKSMICIVAEMAHRCIELNGFLGRDSVVKTPGIVMIDELDLYLHPRWQQHILNDLKAAFPLIQFIVSSHSPFIIQSVYSRNIITLDGHNDAADPNRRSIEEIVLQEMNLDTVRSLAYQKMVAQAETYYNLVKTMRADSVQAQDIKHQLDAIEAEFSNDPAYVALLRAERKSNETR